MSKIVKIQDDTTWPDPTCEEFHDLNRRLRYAAKFEISRAERFQIAQIMDAYNDLITHPAFTLKSVQNKISGIRKAIKNSQGETYPKISQFKP